MGELQRIAAAIESFARAENWPPDLEFHIQLMIEEVGTNIINHGHDDSAGHQAGIEIVSDSESVTVEVVDDGRPFDPLNDAPAPDLDAPLEARRVGGLGVHLIHTMADEARYRRDGTRNRLTLVRRRNG